jgi:hypothetical protein
VFCLNKKKYHVFDIIIFVGVREPVRRKVLEGKYFGRTMLEGPRWKGNVGRTASAGHSSKDSVKKVVVPDQEDRNCKLLMSSLLHSVGQRGGKG